MPALCDFLNMAFGYKNKLCFQTSKVNTGSGYHFPPPGDLCDSGIKPHLLNQQADSLPLSLQGSPALVLDDGKLSVKKKQLLEDRNRKLHNNKMQNNLIILFLLTYKSNIH